MECYIEETGNKAGPLMLFVHGGGVGGWMWNNQLDYFTGYHCVVPDLPEQGKSSETTSFTIRKSAELMLDLVEEKAAGKKVIVVGFSLGAQIIVQMLSMRPDIIDYAMINSALVRSMPRLEAFIGPAVRMTHPLTKRRSFALAQSKTLAIPKELFETYFQESNKMTAETLIRILQENMMFSIPLGFKNAKTKILVTVGEKERGIMRKSAEDILTNSQNGQGIILAKTGHGAPLANPSLFNSILDKWLKEDSNS
ncbi:alpha/beta hydrolase [Oceanobacillus iheyensis]|nr:alpha/beta hydrolase [Oceanobacillus iheyensis]